MYKVSGIGFIGIILSFVITGIAKASSDGNWAGEVGDNARAMVRANLQQQFNQQQLRDTELQATELLNIGVNSEQNQSDFASKIGAELYVFVSSSMPKPLLKSYVEEAAKYGAVVVFNGLPKGSFKELAKLVGEINPNNAEVQMQIDDEAFARFGVREVPTMVLAKSGDHGSWQEAEAVTMFDKISGNVGIYHSLKRFASSGELAAEAIKYLDDKAK